MSLLLDALKKAAEQKAQKSQEGTPAVRASDDTDLEAAADDVSMENSRADTDRVSMHSGLPPASIADGFGESSRPESAGDDTDDVDTKINPLDSSEVSPVSLDQHLLSDSDQTFVFDAEDVSDFMGEPELVNRDAADQADTDLRDLALRATTDDDESGASGSDTDAVMIEPDRTNVSLPFQPADFEQTGGVQSVRDQSDNALDISKDHAGLPADDTDLNVSQTGDTDSGADDDKKSVMPAEYEDSHIAGLTATTHPRDRRPTPVVDDGGELELVDIAKPPADDDRITLSQTLNSATNPSVGVAARLAQSTQTRSANSTRADATSTRTYAPDNYDRTLMRLPSDDASKLFAGMKPDSDVVMTPDYAKQVFRSKSSAQRIQYLKFYSAIAIVILLTIGIYGANEYQGESETIDASLQSLKLDPMPGFIKNGLLTDPTTLPDTDVDPRTVELIERAASTENQTVFPEQGVIAEESPSKSPAASEAASNASSNQSKITALAAEVSTLEDDITTKIIATETLVKAEAEINTSSTNSTRLQISQRSQVKQKDIWLQQAYRAYQDGDMDQAMARYNQVLDLEPGNRNALLARAAINARRDDSLSAIEDYQTLLLANPKDTLAMTSLLAVANFSPEIAESQLKLMIRDEPNSPYLNFALANAYGAQNRWQEAQGYYFTALENNPQDPNYAYNLAVSLEHIAQPKAAIPYYRRALANGDRGLATFDREQVGRRLQQLQKP